jgi:aminopeptidase-like protein
LFPAFATAEKVEVDLVVDAVLKARLEKGVVGQPQRQGVVRELFEEVGCAVEEQKVNKRSANLICTLPGETDSTILVGGHFDFANVGTGIVDDWSGVSLLPSLYQALKGRTRHHTYIFVAFAAEEDGLLGSAQYLRSLSEEKKARIRGFVNLECLGLTPVKVWTHRSTPFLVARLDAVARAVGIVLEGVNVERVGDDDTHNFSFAKIPVISIHSITQETLGILHSVRDRLDAIHLDDYSAAYKLVAYYLAYLDVRTE